MLATSSLSSSLQPTTTAKCPFHFKSNDSKGVLQQLTVKEKIEKDEVVNIITDLFLAAADTVSIQIIALFFPFSHTLRDIREEIILFLFLMPLKRVAVTQGSISIFL